MADALVTPALLTWARQRDGFHSEATLAQKLNVAVDKVVAWESGGAKPTFVQAQKLAKVTNTAFGYLFLDNPPQEVLPIPDLRTVKHGGVDQPSAELRDIVTQLLQQQAWYKDYLLAQNSDDLPFVGRFNVGSRVGEIVTDIRSTLKIEQPAKGGWQNYHTVLLKAVEAAGVLVMRSGIVGSNTRRKLAIDEFRDFALSDKKAPVIFINSSDVPAARLFTLIHELAHIWVG